MLQGALREVLALGDALGRQVSLDEGAGDAALPQLDRQADADGPAADDDHLVRLAMRRR